jgi:hypothetical protein
MLAVPTCSASAMSFSTERGRSGVDHHLEAELEHPPFLLVPGRDRLRTAFTHP